MSNTMPKITFAQIQNSSKLNYVSKIWARELALTVKAFVAGLPERVKLKSVLTRSCSYTRVIIQVQLSTALICCPNLAKRAKMNLVSAYNVISALGYVFNLVGQKLTKTFTEGAQIEYNWVNLF